jgi:hypothetical protein
MDAPNGWISHDLLIWNELDRRGFVAKGFVLEVPDLRHADDRPLVGWFFSRWNLFGFGWFGRVNRVPKAEH